MRNLTDNLKGVKDSISKEYKHPAKLPPLTWLSREIPEAPIGLEIFKTKDNSVCIRWQTPLGVEENKDLTYNIYASKSDYFDVDNPGSVIATLLNRTEVYLKPKEYDEGMYYTVTSSNRFHNESKIEESAFFIYSDLIK